MDSTRLKDDPTFKLGMLFGMALAHAQRHAEEEYTASPKNEKFMEMERMTNLILDDYLESKKTT